MHAGWLRVVTAPGLDLYALWRLGRRDARVCVGWVAGLRWLCTSIAANYKDLDARVKREMEEFKAAEKKRKEDLAKARAEREAAAAAAAAASGTGAAPNKCVLWPCLCGCSRAPCALGDAALPLSSRRVVCGRSPIVVYSCWLPGVLKARCSR